MLWIDPGYTIQDSTCDCCGGQRRQSRGFVHKEEVGKYAIFFATCYHHQNVHEAWIDVIFDEEWGGEHLSGPCERRVTFGCRVGPVQNSPLPACTLVNAAAAAPDQPFFGHKLSREEALSHPLLKENWEVVDHLLEAEPMLHNHIYSQPN
ncbi:hypothetical protein GCM10023085_40950 [Actinomadura viridis]|uniref:Uncharacterized protein n=1 Tax=Actinomadura viridis TaxID=58110 RepID=A0A931DRR4_9ACTN|nr:hypothetical protein [Actinomadura viridis]MBG6092626.1 hypothetical protein [Actinomadura viridis]